MRLRHSLDRKKFVIIMPPELRMQHYRFIRTGKKSLLHTNLNLTSLRFFPDQTVRFRVMKLLQMNPAFGTDNLLV